VKIVTSFPHQVEDVEHLRIPLPDVHLAARLWLPADARSRPVPAVLEYVPYRKRAGTRWRDEPIHRYFAGHGYASVRVDVRGSGESDGLLADEYSEEELADGLEVIRWIAAQPWCSGAVGMIGKSWGGINALQLAALRPPQLRAVITVCSSDDRYGLDAHYMGGCLLNENLIWGSSLLTLAALPPDPALVGDAWRVSWRRRLERLELFPARWMRHPRRDAYWRRGSVCEDYSRVACPVFAVGGWADAYVAGVLRLLARLEVPRRGLVGPWAHLYPHDADPEPSIGFLQEAVRWWDCWLKGVETGLTAEPTLVAWMQESVRPAVHHHERPGRWIGEDAWPSPRLRARRYGLGAGTLTTEPAAAAPAAVRSAQTVGMASGRWCCFGEPGEYPGDQRDDDAGSLVFDTAPLGERLEILGSPRVELMVTADRPHTFVTVRLCDVAPDGSSTRMTYGVANLAPLEPGRGVRVDVELEPTAWAVPAGHRLRLAVSNAYWPLAWPSRAPATLTVFPADSALELPERPPRAGEGALRPFGDPEGAPPPAMTTLTEPLPRREVTRAASGRVELRLSSGADETGEVARTRYDAIDLEIGHAIDERFAIDPDDPLTAEAEIVHRRLMRRGGWSPRVETRCRLTADAEWFRLEASVEAREGGAPFCERRWDEKISRDLL